ncbi:MAG: hypothetical protein GY838_13055 [bacterium]|nr:hypothetical protein [bacterium]
MSECAKCTELRRERRDLRERLIAAETRVATMFDQLTDASTKRLHLQMETLQAVSRRDEQNQGLYRAIRRNGIALERQAAALEELAANKEQKA